MKERKKQMKSESISPYELSLQFAANTASDNCPTIWYWRGGWYRWSGAHYDSVPRQRIEKEILAFLQANTSIPIKATTIHGIMEFLKITQSCEASHSRFWLQPSGRPAPRHLFPMKNGILNLEADPILLPHDPTFFTVSSTTYSYSPDACCNNWIEFLNSLWPHEKDRLPLKEWFGYCLLPDTSQQKIFSILGPPRSGKSTIARVLTELLGRENVASPSIRSLSGNFGLWGLLDKSLAIIPDATLPKPCPALEELLKSISGEDAVDVQRKGMSPLTGIRLPTRLMLLGNETPIFRDPSGALNQRIITLKTTRSFAGKEDRSLTDKLLKELPGILRWSIGGLKWLRDEGRFRTPDTLDTDAIMKAIPDSDRVRKIVISYDGPVDNRNGSYRKRRATNRRKGYSHK